MLLDENVPQIANNFSLASSAILETTLEVHLGNQTFNLQPDEFLDFCWRAGLDTVCHICKTSFDIAIAPPVRTLSIKTDCDRINASQKLPSLVITNSHLSCIRARNIKYIPISHAWHTAVAEAYASGVSNPAAVQMIYEIPIRILLAVTQRFGHDLQIWHDYLSIPQWQDRFRGTTILPQIFQIFKHGIFSIVHLDDQSNFQILDTYNSDQLAHQLPGLRHIFNSRWFSRMWPVVEYSLCKDAYLLNSDFEVMPNTLGSLTRQIFDCRFKLMEDVLVQSTPFTKSVLDWIDTVPIFVRERIKNKCLGYIYDMIANQGCRSYCDRFIASCALLEHDGHTHPHMSELPADGQEACLWLSERCLQHGDFSPLLLHPSEESRYPKAHWLKGHSAMTSTMWGLGVETQSARAIPRLEDHAVHLEVELLGRVSDIHPLDVPAKDKYYGFAQVLPHLAKLADGSPWEFLRGLEQVYPSQFFWTSSDANNQYQFPGVQYKTPRFDDIEGTLENLLEQYKKVKGSLCDDFISLLALSAAPIENLGPFASVGRLQFYGQECVSSENTLILLSCLKCNKASLFRVTLWQKPKVEAHFYLIPELAYQYSLPSGMGIMVENNKIIGRMRFGSSACSCDNLAAVTLR